MNVKLEDLKKIENNEDAKSGQTLVFCNCHQSWYRIQDGCIGDYKNDSQHLASKGCFPPNSKVVRF